MKPQFLIIIPTRGTSPYLRETLASVQSLSSIARVVIVCPGSVIPQIKHQFGDVEILPEVGPGLYRAVDTGVRYFSGFDAFCWVNDDDLLCAQGVRAGLEELGKSDLVFGRVAMVDKRGEPLGWIPTARRSADWLPLIKQGIVPLAQPGTLISLRAYNYVNGFKFSYNLGADLELFARILSAGFRATYIDARVAHFRLWQGQLSKQEDQVQEELLSIARSLPDQSCTRRVLARLRFASENIPTYMDRLRRHGFKSMKQIYRHA